jgi:hypothetical protein
MLDLYPKGDIPQEQLKCLLRVIAGHFLMSDFSQTTSDLSPESGHQYWRWMSALGH